MNRLRFFVLGLILMASASAGLAQITVPLPDRALVKLVPDYIRPRIYGLNRGNGSVPGTLLAFNATNGVILGEITLGLKPTDMAMTPGGDALYVINTGARTLMNVDLTTFSVTATRSFTTPDTYDVNNPLHIAVGRSNLLHFTDGAWAPAVYTFDFPSGTNVAVFNDGEGTGGLTTTRDGNTMYTWRQFGWGAGNVNSWVRHHDARTTDLTVLDTSFVSWRRDPLDTPLLLNGSETVVFNKQQMFAATNVGVLLNSFTENIYAISLDGSIALGTTKLFNSQTAAALTNFAFSSTVQALSGDQRRLFRYKSDVSEMYVYDMSQLASVSGPTPQPTPADGSVVSFAPTNLMWSPSPVALSYFVYFGTNQAQVAAATMSSSQYLGSASSPGILLNRPMQAGKTYFWRLDVGGFNSTNKGPVWSFTISTVAVLPARVDVGAIASFNPAPVTLSVTSSAPRGFTASVAGANWLSLSVSSGTTPATLSISFNTATLPVGTYSNQINVVAGGATVPVPVTVDVRPLNITKMATDYQRPYIYALQAPPFSGQSGRLLFINTETENVELALPIGENPTDLAVHYAENRIYVANWGRDETYVVDLNTRTLLPSLHLGADVYKINAGRAGRIYVEGLDQWVYGHIVDTSTGQIITTGFFREGDAEVSPNGRYYYHSDNNISGAGMTKYDVIADQFTSVKGVGGHYYYGSRNVIIAGDGSRLFWTGAVYDDNLNELANLGAEIYATTLHGELAFSSTSVYNTRNGQVLYTLPVSSSVTAVAGNQQKVFLYDSGQQRLRVIPMSQITPLPGPGLVPNPPDGSVAGLPLSHLNWSVSPFAIEYQVFLGTSSNTVATATTNSPTYLGSTSSNAFPLLPNFQYGTTYYWRVDAVGFSSVTTGMVWRFTTAALTVSPQSLSIKGVVGLPILPQTLNVTAPISTAWNLTTTESWATAAPSSGGTPASITVLIDASGMAAGIYSNVVLITSGSVTLRVPITLELFNLAATKMIADPNRPYIYVLHAGSGNFEDAFLLFLNTDTGIVEKVIGVGIRPTDMTINRFDDRLYVSNWQHNNTRVVDLATRTELTPLQLGTDVYKINAGRSGRIVSEEQDQWINATLIDSSDGTAITTAFFREGDGEFDPTGRYYYHGDNNISGAGITKYDLNNSTFVSVASAGGHYYFGSRNIVLSFDGSRLFWTGAAYDANLTDLGNIGAEIYGCSTNGSIAFSDRQAFETATRQAIFNLPVTTTIMTVDRADQRLWFFNPGTRRIESILLSVIRAPTITQQPASTTVQIGGAVYLTVTTVGLTPLSYQWLFNGTNVVGQTNYFLSMNNVQPSQDGDYRVIIGNPYGAITSAVAHVTVVVAPSITQQPQNTSAPAGGTATFTVQASGTASLRYQWSFEGANLPGATNATLTLNDVQAADDGAYRVTVVNTAGSVSSAAAILRVLPAPPTILSGPSNITVAAASSVAFAVIAKGSTPFSYQWLFNGSAIPEATDSVFSLNNAQAPNAGAYQAIVANSLGLATSAVATLTVTPVAPYFVAQPLGATAPVGATITLNSLARGSEPITYQWRRNGINFPVATPSLVISNAATNNSGQYVVLASNAVGVATSLVANVTITGAPPVFTLQPASVTVAASNTLTLTARVSGSPPLRYQWYFQGVPLPGQTNASLVYPNVQNSNAGPYFLVASNSVGVATSVIANVTVTVPATIITGLSNIAVDAGAWVVLAVNAQGAAPLSYIWEFNGLPISGATGASLTLSNVQVAHAGAYRVSVANAYGDASSTMALTVFNIAGTIAAWGDNSGGQADVPNGIRATIAIAGGDFHSLALHRDGGVTAWGFNADGATSVPATLSNVVAIAAGAAHNLALQLNGSVAAWGRNDAGQTVVPLNATSVVAVAAGDSHSVALRQNGTLVMWGDNSFGQRNGPQASGFVTAIAAGRNHTLALRNNGTVAGWGMNSSGQSQPPQALTGVKAIAAGYLHSLALRTNGTVVAWGDDSYGQASVPPGLSNVIAIAAGEIHSFALRGDGAIIAWGDNSYAQLDEPTGLTNASVIASGYYHGLAMVPAPMLQHLMIADRLVLRWSGPFVLQQSPTATGPFEDCGGATSYTNSVSTNTMKFFRLRSLK